MNVLEALAVSLFGTVVAVGTIIGTYIVITATVVLTARLFGVAI